MALAARRVASRQRRRSWASGAIVWRSSKASDPSRDSYTATRSGSAMQALRRAPLQADVPSRACCDGDSSVNEGRVLDESLLMRSCRYRRWAGAIAWLCGRKSSSDSEWLYS